MYWPYRLTARTDPSQGSNQSSILCRVTKTIKPRKRDFAAEVRDMGAKELAVPAVTKTRHGGGAGPTATSRARISTGS